MANKIYQDRFQASIATALQEAKNVERIGHPGLTGRYRELLVEKILQPIVGPQFGFGSGKIVDSIGNASREIDLIIYQRNSIPPILWSGRDGVFPIEACCYAIEVKSRLTAFELESTVANARTILSLKERRLSLGRQLKPTQIPIVLFAFESQINRMIDVIGHLEKNDKDWQLNPVLNVICIASLGYIAFDANIRSWIGSNAESDFSHITEFALGIANTLLNWPGTDVVLGPYLSDVQIGEEPETTFD